MNVYHHEIYEAQPVSINPLMQMLQKTHQANMPNLVLLQDDSSI